MNMLCLMTSSVQQGIKYLVTVAPKKPFTILLSVCQYICVLRQKTTLYHSNSSDEKEI